MWRTWDAGLPRVCWLLLNPGMADATRDDPTLRRCMGFARSWGYGGVVIVNLFAYRTPHPRLLKGADDPVGAENDLHMRAAICEADEVVIGWGNHGAYRNRCSEVLPLCTKPVRCLGITKQGHPTHPLYVPASAARMVWTRPTGKIND